MPEEILEKKKPVKTHKELTKGQALWHDIIKKRYGYYMVAPFFIWFVVFTVIPVLLGSVLAFTSFNMLQWPKFVFMDNFTRMFLDDDLFLIALKNTLFYAVICGPASYLISFLTAWFINELSPRWRAFVTVIFYAPNLGGSVYGIFGILFSSDKYGYVNGWLMKLGLIESPILWFENASTVVPLIIIVTLWSSIGLSFLGFIAGLQGVDRHLYEAAAVDGISNRWQELWYVTLPAMKPMLMFGALLSVTGAFGGGGIATGLAGNPSVDYCAYMLSHHIGAYTGVRYEYGYATAMSLVLFAIMLGSNIGVQKIIHRVGQ